MKFALLTADLVQHVETWFDDPETIRYLGGRGWAWRALNLMQTAPGNEFANSSVLARYVWVSCNNEGRPVGLVDIELYEDGAASTALVVAPQARGRGVGRRMLLALGDLPELKDVCTIIGGVEPDNVAACRCLTEAGFAIDKEPDEEGMLRVEKRLRH